MLEQFTIKQVIAIAFFFRLGMFIAEFCIGLIGIVLKRYIEVKDE